MTSLARKFLVGAALAGGAMSLSGCGGDGAEPGPSPATGSPSTPRDITTQRGNAIDSKADGTWVTKAKDGTYTLTLKDGKASLAGPYSCSGRNDTASDGGVLFLMTCEDGYLDRGYGAAKPGPDGISLIVSWEGGIKEIYTKPG